MEGLGDAGEALVAILEAPGGALEAEVRQDSAKMASRSLKSEISRELPSGLSLSGRLLGAFEGVLEALGGLLGAFRGVLEAKMRQDGVLKPQERNSSRTTERMASRGGVLDASWRLLGASWRLLEALGGVLEVLGGVMEAPQGVLECLGGVLEAMLS